MNDQDSDEQERKIGLPGWMKWLAASLAILAVAVFIYGAVENNSESLGTYGDFVGGTLNPTFAFVSFLALLYTINLQLKELALSRKELRLTREELSKSADALKSQNETSKRQRFENTLFSMIGVLNQIVAGMDIGSGANEVSGKDCFTQFYAELQRIYGKKSGILYEDTAENIKDRQTHGILRLRDSYEIFYKKRNTELGHYFRVLFNVFRYIDLNQGEDKIYAKIFRAQFSDQELLVIFYNALSPQGEPLIAYAKKFHLFDNLITNLLLRKEHIDLIDREAFGDNPCLLPPEKVGDVWINEG